MEPGQLRLRDGPGCGRRAARDPGAVPAKLFDPGRGSRASKFVRDAGEEKQHLRARGTRSPPGGRAWVSIGVPRAAGTPRVAVRAGGHRRAHPGTELNWRGQRGDPLELIHRAHPPSQYAEEEGKTMDKPTDKPTDTGMNRTGTPRPRSTRRRTIEAAKATATTATGRRRGGGLVDMGALEAERVLWARDAPLRGPSRRRVRSRASPGP